MILKGNKLSETPYIAHSAKLENVRFGIYNEIGEYNYIENVVLGDYSYTGQFCFVQNALIGKFSNIAAAVRIGPTAHPYERASLHHFTYRPQMFGFRDREDSDFFDRRTSKTVKVGHDTWIGHGAIVMPNVTIGDGAIVGAGAVVTKDIPPYAIVTGVPSEVIKYRFTPQQIGALQRIRWWDWDYERLMERLDDFHLPIDEFIRRYDETIA